MTTFADSLSKYPHRNSIEIARDRDHQERLGQFFSAKVDGTGLLSNVKALLTSHIWLLVSIGNACDTFSGLTLTYFQVCEFVHQRKSDFNNCSSDKIARSSIRTLISGCNHSIRNLVFLTYLSMSSTPQFLEELQ